MYLGAFIYSVRFSLLIYYAISVTTRHIARQRRRIKDTSTFRGIFQENTPAGGQHEGDSAKEKGISVFFPGFKLIPNCDSHAIVTRTPCPSLSFAQMPTDTTTQSGKRVGARVLYETRPLEFGCQLEKKGF